MDEFLHMGGYGLYVWGSYGVTLAVMLFEAVAAIRRRRQAFNDARLEAAAEGER
jgi:heme exporter protein D